MALREGKVTQLDYAALGLEPVQRRLAVDMAIDFLDYDWRLNGLSHGSEGDRS